jgi:hypothetical protein
MKITNKSSIPNPLSHPFHSRLKPCTGALLGLLLLGALSAQAQVSLSGIPYPQDFDTLGSSGSWVDDTTLPGWYAAYDTSGTVTPHTAYANTAGGGNNSSTLYSIGTSSSDPDRALGGAAASTRATLLGLRLVNDTGGVFDDLQVSFDLEQWTSKGNQTVTMSYQVFSAGTGSLTVLSGWDVLTTTESPVASLGTSGSSQNGNLPENRVAGITGGLGDLGLLPGDELWVRWRFEKLVGENAPHGIDNVVVAVPEPSSAALLGLGFLLLVGRLRSAALR